METADYLQDILHAKVALTIITKTKNESFFIEKWIKHHLKIIGNGKLIIFDHMSDDEHVLQVYEKYKNNIILIKFDFHHNDIHDYSLIKDFYDAIGESADFFTALDSDEFLYLYDNNKAIHDASILDYLRENKDCDFFAPCWLDNIEGEESQLNLNSEIHSIKEKAELIDLFDWGKAIVNSELVKKRELSIDKYNFIHTTFMPILDYKKVQTKFFIAHLKNLNKEQRISTNMNKLVTNKILSRNNDFEGLLNIDSEDIKNKTLRSYVKQTQRLVKGLRANLFMAPNLAPDIIMEIGNDDTVHFSNTVTKKAFLKLSNSSYLDLIHYDYSKASNRKHKILKDWIGKYD